MSSNLPPIYKFDLGDYVGLGTIFNKFLANLNLFTQAIYSLMNGGVGFQNMQRSIYSTTVVASTTTAVSFVNPLSIPPSGVSLVKVILQGNTNVAISNAVTVANWTFDGKNISIMNVAGLTSGSTYQLSIEVM